MQSGEERFEGEGERVVCLLVRGDGRTEEEVLAGEWGYDVLEFDALDLEAWAGCGERKRGDLMMK